MKRSDTKTRDAVLAEVKAWLAERNIAMLGELGFENAYVLAMAKTRATTLGVRTLGELAGRARELTIAGDYEFFARPEWARLRAAYGLNFREQRQMQPEFMYQAAAHGEVDVIAGYTSDGRIAQFDLTTLDDPKAAIPPYDAILLLAPRRADDDALRAALQPLIGRIDVALMRAANLRAAQGQSPRAAAQWLDDQIRKK